MRKLCRVAVPFLFALSARLCAQTPDHSYRMKVPVNEVSVPFHAADAHGIPITDLKVEDLRLLDNNKPPKEIVSFNRIDDMPIRVGFLMDASSSAHADVSRDTSIIWSYVTERMDMHRDLAFVMRFDGMPHLQQDWTGDPSRIAAGLRASSGSPRDGSAIFDTIYRACLNQFKPGSSTYENFILLFSDGEENQSRTGIEDDIEECQLANTAIYVITPARAMAGVRCKSLPRRPAAASSPTLIPKPSAKTSNPSTPICERSTG